MFSGFFFWIEGIYHCVIFDNNKIYELIVIYHMHFTECIRFIGERERREFQPIHNLTTHLDDKTLLFCINHTVHLVIWLAAQKMITLYLLLMNGQTDGCMQTVAVPDQFQIGYFLCNQIGVRILFFRSRLQMRLTTAKIVFR